MKKKLAISLLALGLVPAMAHAQELVQQCCAMPEQQQAAVVPQDGSQQQTAYAPEQLDQLLAPIALYPDEMLSQVLMASTYPLEVVEAYRWVSDPNNAQLQGDQLASAMASQPWDPSVKSLVAFPQTLKIMNDNLQWTEQLGEAFIAQQANVSDSVQRLRQRAEAAHTLTSTPQQVVSTEGQDIAIQPADPQTVYVPTYNPVYTYGAWPYASYPPYYFSDIVYTTPYPIYASGIAIVAPLWGWNHWDWHNRRIAIDDHRYYELNNNHPPVQQHVWQHDADHRGNVAYNNPALRQQYQQQWQARHANEGTMQQAAALPTHNVAPVQNNFQTPSASQQTPSQGFNGNRGGDTFQTPAAGQPTPSPGFNGGPSPSVNQPQAAPQPQTQPQPQVQPQPQTQPLPQTQPHSDNRQQLWQHAGNQYVPQQTHQYRPMIARHVSPQQVSFNAPRTQPQLRQAPQQAFSQPQLRAQPVMMRQPISRPNATVAPRNNNGARQAHDGHVNNGNNIWHR